MTFLKYSFILACLLVISSCKNELKLNAPYKEVPTVYAVLNPFESMQMIRINKVFLGETDASVMAKVADSINYQPGELTVTLDRFLNGVQIDASPDHPDPAKRKTIVFRDSLIKTDEGTFNNSQRVYVCTDNLLKMVTPATPTTPATYTVYGEYVLTIKNNKTGNVYTAKASPINQVSPFQTGQPIAPPFFPYPEGTNTHFINYNAIQASTQVGSILFLPVDRGKIYQLTIRGHFRNDEGGVFSYDYFDYAFYDLKANYNLNSTNYVRVTFKSGDYFLNAGLALEKKNLPNVTSRKMYMMEYIIHASTEEYVDFIEFQKPSMSLNQNKPLYSNFTNKAALGIFTFRSTCAVNKELDANFHNGFSSNKNTCKYKFLDSKGIWQGCK